VQVSARVKYGGRGEKEKPFLLPTQEMGAKTQKWCSSVCGLILSGLGKSTWSSLATLIIKIKELSWMAEMGVKTGSCYPGLPKTQGQQVGLDPFKDPGSLLTSQKGRQVQAAPLCTPFL
jgi:hypothetical protein